jgi:exodeoxyribonuclease VII large subunit
VPERHLHAERGRLRQLLREARAASQRGIDQRTRLAGRGALVIARKGAATSAEAERSRATVAARARALAGGARRAIAARERGVADIGVALRAHEPQRTLERGYALVTDRDDEPVTSASRAREARDVRVRFADDSVETRVEDR